METLYKILDLIWKNNISEIDFCKAININKSAVTDWKKGKTKSYFKHIDKIANYFNVSTAYLLNEETQEKNNLVNTMNSFFSIEISNGDKTITMPKDINFIPLSKEEEDKLISLFRNDIKKFFEEFENIQIEKLVKYKLF